MTDVEMVRSALEQIAGNEWTCYAHTGDVHEGCAVSMAREALAALSRLEAQQPAVEHFVDVSHSFRDSADGIRTYRPIGASRPTTAGDNNETPDPRSGPCRHCGRLLTQHGGFARCAGGETQFEPVEAQQSPGEPGAQRPIRGILCNNCAANAHDLCVGCNCECFGKEINEDGTISTETRAANSGAGTDRATREAAGGDAKAPVEAEEGSVVAQPTPPVECPHVARMFQLISAGIGLMNHSEFQQTVLRWWNAARPELERITLSTPSTPCQPCPTCAELREKTRQPLVGKESPEKVVESALVGATFGLDSRDGRNNQLRQRAYDGLVALPHLVAERDSLCDQVKRLVEGLRPLGVNAHGMLRDDALVRLQFDAGGQLGTVTVAEIRRAAALLAEHEEPEGCRHGAKLSEPCPDCGAGSVEVDCEAGKVK